MNRVLTHIAPDLDAIVSAWLAQKYLFAGEAEVCFVARKIDPERFPGDCLVDIGSAHDPDRLWFDHKPPAFPNRNQTCAAKLVWEHLLRRGEPVLHLEPLVTVTFEGDTRRHSPALKQSRADGPHAELALTMRRHATDGERYEQMRHWLDGYEERYRL
jgi:hypothetical protein